MLQAESPDAAHGGDDALHDVSFECYNRPNMDTLSKTDAMVGAGTRSPSAQPHRSAHGGHSANASDRRCATAGH